MPLREVWMFVAISSIVLSVGVIVITRATRRDPSVSPRLLMLALAARVAGALAYYGVFRIVYGGLGDSVLYASRGVEIAEGLGSFHPPPLLVPGPASTGTQVTEYLAGVMFTITGPTVLGAFIVWAALSFVGAWYFYKAFRVSFPEGNSRLYGWLIFLLPSMLYWASFLGKDALMLLFLGVATYGCALLFRGRFARGLVCLAIGEAGVMVLRAPIALAITVAALAGLLTAGARRTRLPAPRWAASILVITSLAIAAASITRSSMRGGSVAGAFAEQETEAHGGTGDLSHHRSNFEAPNPFTPAGLPVAIVTTNLRPFPWEARTGLQAVQALESFFVLAVLVWRRREIVRGLATWRSNGMVVVVAVSFLALSILLSPLGNFGLLSRQRTQVLPFLLLLPAMVMPRGKQEDEPSGEPGRAKVG